MGTFRKKVLTRRPGWPLDRFSTVERAWDGATVVCIGGGPSLTGAQCSLVAQARAAEKVRVIAVNDAYRLAPWADVLYFADTKWWRWHKDRPEFQVFAGEKCSIEQTGAKIEDGAVHILRNGGPDGLSADSAALRTGQNSGYQAINLAVLSGAKTILLLGYDGKVAKDGKTHFFGDHPRREIPIVYDIYRKVLRQLPPLLNGVRVINCSPDSAVDAFPKMTLAAALDSLDFRDSLASSKQLESTP